MPRVTVVLPWHLVRLSGSGGKAVAVDVPAPPGEEVTLGDVVDALARQHPVLGTALREPIPTAGPAGYSGWRLRPYIRAFAGTHDLTASGLEARLPRECLDGNEPVRLVGAIAGGSPGSERGSRKEMAPPGQ